MTYSSSCPPPSSALAPMESKFGGKVARPVNVLTYLLTYLLTLAIEETVRFW